MYYIYFLLQNSKNVNGFNWKASQECLLWTSTQLVRHASEDAKLRQWSEESLAVSNSPIEKLLRFLEEKLKKKNAIYFRKDTEYWVLLKLLSFWSKNENYLHRSLRKQRIKMDIVQSGARADRDGFSGVAKMSTTYKLAIWWYSSIFYTVIPKGYKTEWKICLVFKMKPPSTNVCVFTDSKTCQQPLEIF